MKSRKWCLVVCAFMLAFCCSHVAAKGTDDSAKAQLSVKGTSLVNAEGEKVVLRGVSYGWHNSWGDFYNASTVKTLSKDWKATVVRAAMGVEPKGGYITDPEKALACVTAVVDAAIKNKIYAIIDWHSHHIRTEEAKEFFTKMATKYKDSPYVIYELFNEPVDDSWEQVKAYSEELIRVIRAIDPDNLILVGCPHWDQDVHIAADSPITGYNNIMYTLHFYAATHKQDLRDRGDYALSKGLPLFVSECAGMEATGDGPLDKEEWSRWVDWMQQNSLSWVAWSMSSKEETCSMIVPFGPTNGKWKEEDIKEWGKMVRDELKNTPPRH